ncbi:MAG: protoheme IX farnesyltransferase [Candidatus Sericytochromatia bacterium]|nr:protoheme IX farnesyltransferase [Candidatus Sericytochromatia bacterium]
MIETPAISPLLKPSATWRDYWSLTKPSIVLLVLVTGLPAMMMAQQGMPPLSLVLLTLGGTALAAGGAATINMYVDRDIDGIMERTAKRPSVTDTISPGQILAFGLILSVASTLMLALGVNLLAAAVSVGSILFYAGFYTMYLKRTTPHNTVIGGVAGAVAPLIGWAAVRGEIGLPAWILFMVIFLWQPPHFWALAIYRVDDYAKASIPMLPNTHGIEYTRWQMLIYTALLIPFTLVLYPMQQAGGIYLATAVVLDTIYLVKTVQLLRNPSRPASMKLFFFSILYLMVLFIALVIDLGVRYGIA